MQWKTHAMRYPLMATSWSPRPTKPAHGEDGSMALMTASLQMPPTSQMGCTCRVGERVGMRWVMKEAKLFRDTAPA